MHVCILRTCLYALFLTTTFHKPSTYLSSPDVVPRGHDAPPERAPRGRVHRDGPREFPGQVPGDVGGAGAGQAGVPVPGHRGRVLPGRHPESAADNRGA